MNVHKGDMYFARKKENSLKLMHWKMDIFWPNVYVVNNLVSVNAFLEPVLPI